MPAPLLTDTELLAAIKRNDEKAFRLLFDRYWAIIYKKAFSYLKDPEICAELVNDVFHSVWKRRQQVNIINIKNYLSAATSYRIYSHLRSKQNNPLMYVEDYSQIEPISDNTYAPSSIRMRELNWQLENVLGALPTRCREMFLLSRNEHLTNQQIAERLGISQRTVENQISNALRYLRPRLKHISLIAFFLVTTYLR